ncbi:FAD-dependent oxidoreductase [Terrimonas sp. NA20]|uniref:FAD-dependent oxidoreductase n=1 Tax=Terrimonas ginsenosidimutans TaxID=2908004 RepID=A0ABS9KMM2_9BACT|nr:FAD-dependent oxidoreductase [Terrimonas ginsenosidimutans]MCG2613556.1 FAD-dependent oxidoreductase [Terrimonas ginsenosidimutans]
MIKRDGYQVSLWQDSVPPYQSATPAHTNSKYDVIIVGGGITGISTAHQLQKAGKHCLVLEANTLCFGTTGGTTAHLNTLLDTPYTTIRKNFNAESAAIIAEATASAIQLIKQNIRDYQIDCHFEETSAYLFSQNESEDKELEDIADASIEAGLELRFSKTIPVPIPFTRVFEVLGQAKFHPVQYVYGIAKAFERIGGHIKQDCRVTGVEENETLTVQTSNGSFQCTDLVYATHIPPGVNLLHLRCAPWRSYAMAFKLTDDNYPEGLAYDMKDPYFYYRTQIVNGEQYLIAGGRDHKTGEDINTEVRFTELEAEVRKHFNIAAGSYRWSSQYYESADGLPYIGHLPGHPDHVYVASGFGGNGMVYSTVAAIALRSLLTNEETPVSKLLNPNRLKPVAGFKSFISHNAHVAGELISRLFPGEKLEELSALARGEGKVITYEGEKIAMFKDDHGELHAINPVCTHLKCEVKWNGAERSWDCPCHGARYNTEGKVLTAPADMDMQKMQVENLATAK